MVDGNFFPIGLIFQRIIVKKDDLFLFSFSVACEVDDLFINKGKHHNNNKTINLNSKIVAIKDMKISISIFTIIEIVNMVKENANMN